jgi:ribosome-associated heat shock protein Hsp15
LYEETAESRAARECAAQARRLAPEPAAGQARPTKRERRALDRSTHGWQRWSASTDKR